MIVWRLKCENPDRIAVPEPPVRSQRGPRAEDETAFSIHLKTKLKTDYQPLSLSLFHTTTPVYLLYIATIFPCDVLVAVNPYCIKCIHIAIK